MTGTFSTIINFSLLGILQRIHKLSIKGELEVEDTGMKIFHGLKGKSKRLDVENLYQYILIQQT